MLIIVLCPPTLRSACTCYFQKDNDLTSQWSSSRRTVLGKERVEVYSYLHHLVYVASVTLDCLYFPTASTDLFQGSCIHLKKTSGKLKPEETLSTKTVSQFGVLNRGPFTSAHAHKEQAQSCFPEGYQSQEIHLLQGLWEHLSFL